MRHIVHTKIAQGAHDDNYEKKWIKNLSYVGDYDSGHGELWIIHIPLVSVYDPRQDFLFFHYTAATDLDESL